MKKQKYAVRKLKILTSDEEAKMNYLQHVRVNKITQSFSIDMSNRLSPFTYIGWLQPRVTQTLTQCYGFLSV